MNKGQIESTDKKVNDRWKPKSVTCIISEQRNFMYINYHVSRELTNTRETIRKEYLRYVSI